MNKKEKTCDTCLHRGMGFHKVRGIRTHTFECQSGDSLKREKRVRLNYTCEHYFPEKGIDHDRMYVENAE